MNARKNHHLFPRWLFSSFVSVAECSSSSFASALNDEESSSKHLEPSSSKNNIRHKNEEKSPRESGRVEHNHAKQALRELSLRQISQNYQPTFEENKTVRDFVYSSVSRVLFAFSITGVFGFASVDVKSLKMGTSGKSTFKNARNVFRARVMIGLATGVLGGMFEHRSVQFYKNLCVKILDVKEGESKMPGELAQILRDLDPLGEFVKDQERKRNRERLSGFRDGRVQMTKTTRPTTTSATVAARGAPFKRDDDDDEEEEEENNNIIINDENENTSPLKNKPLRSSSPTFSEEPPKTTTTTTTTTTHRFRPRRRSFSDSSNSANLRETTKKEKSEENGTNNAAKKTAKTRREEESKEYTDEEETNSA